MRRLLAEPLVHFLGIGLLLFLAYALIAPVDSRWSTVVPAYAIADAPKKDAGGPQMPGGGGMGGMDM